MGGAAPGLGGGGDADVTRIVANIFISFIGAGVLGLPYAFKEAGLVEGAIVMTLVCYLSIRAMLLLIDCKYMLLSVVESSPDAEDEAKAKLLLNGDAEKGDVSKRLQQQRRKISYSDVGFAAFGATGRLTVDAMLLVSQVGFCCAYLIFISENLSTFVSGLAQHQWLVVILPPLFFLTLIPDLNNLAVFSLLAQISNLFAFAVVFWFDFEHLHLASPEHRREFSISGFPFFFSIAIYCFEGAGMILSLEESVPESLRPKFKKMFVYTIVAVTSLYISFGVSGYLSYGRETRDIITLNLPVGAGLNFAAIVKVCLSFSLFFTYPVMLFPVTALLEERCCAPSPAAAAVEGEGSEAKKVSSALYPNSLRLFLVTLTGLIVLLVPRFADLMALVGATCCTFLGFIMPGLCHLVIGNRTRKQGTEKADPTLNYVLVITGVIGAVLGTADALAKISS